MNSKNTPLSKEEVQHIAQLANLPLSDQEVVTFALQLGETVSYVSMLEEVNTDHVEPTSQVTGLVNVLAEDESRPSFSQEVALKNAPSVKDGYFKVSAVLSE